MSSRNAVGPIKSSCLLCDTNKVKLFFVRREGPLQGRSYYLCQTCKCIFVDPDQHLSLPAQKKIYDLHQNSPHSFGYLDFLNTLLQPLALYLSAGLDALDFGCGPGPAMPQLLARENVTTYLYDPLYANNPQVLERKFDVVVATEVVEHFSAVGKDWQLLHSLVKPRGILAVMTQFIPLRNKQFDADIFGRWHYLHDPTHICFYSEKTFAFLCENFGWEQLYLRKNVSIMRKRY